MNSKNSTVMAGATSDGDTIEDLALSVQALPQELFELIYDYTFTPDSEEVAINVKYKPPAQLQVDRQSRELFSREYCSNSTFIISIQNFHDDSVYPTDLFDGETPLWVRITHDQNRAFLYDIMKGLGPL